MEECNADSIRRITVQFKGSSELKEAVDDIKFEYRPGYVDTSVIDEEGSTPDSGDDNGNNNGGGGNSGGGGDFVG